MEDHGPRWIKARMRKTFSGPVTTFQARMKIEAMPEALNPPTYTIQRRKWKSEHYLGNQISGVPAEYIDFDHE